MDTADRLADDADAEVWYIHRKRENGRWYNDREWLLPRTKSDVQRILKALKEHEPSVRRRAANIYTGQTVDEDTA